MKFHLVSLGCEKNLVDSEFMIGLMLKEGYEFTQNPEEAEIIIVNTCSFIHDAKQESIDTILELNEYRSYKLKCLIVTGCLSQRYSDEILSLLPEIDAILGASNYDRIGDAVRACLSSNEQQSIIGDINDLPIAQANRVITTPGHFEYLKIAEGCDKHCTYCAIPKIRGNYRSYPIEELIKQAKMLADEGVKELILVAQETTVYGVDLYGHKALPRLLKELSKIDGIEWIRLMYAYPEEIDDELIEEMAVNPKVLHYIDMPIQHSEDTILKRMGRRCSKSDLISIISRLRARIPDICIRTTLITGFPGENQEDFEGVYNFVDETEFDRLGVFTYSCEEDTPAALMPDQVSEDIKKSRYAELMELQQEIVFENNEKMIGKKMQAMIEGFLPDEGVYVARTYRDAPDIDGLVFIKYSREHMTGDLVDITITGAYEYDLNGEEE